MATIIGTNGDDRNRTALNGTNDRGDTIIGKAGRDELFGNGGNDRLNGGLNNDLLNGGAGSDTADYSNIHIGGTKYIGATAGVTVNLNVQGVAQNTGGAGLDTLVSIENLIGTNFNDTLTGNGAKNVLSGLGGDDTLDGRGGIDTASYATALAGVAVSLLDGDGQASGGAGLDTLLNIENLTGSNFNDTIITDFSENSTFNGGNGDDYLEANHSIGDRLNGGGGNDTLIVGNGFSTLNGGDGDDYLNGGDGGVLNGGDGDDLLEAGNGVQSSILNGGAGADTLYGSGGAAGNDTYDYNAISDSPAGVGRDTIVNFYEGEGDEARGDQIDLRDIDAIAGGADNPFAYIGTSAFPAVTPFTVAGQLRYVTGVPGVGGLLQGNTDSDAAAEFEIQLVGNPALVVGGANSDILL